VRRWGAILWLFVILGATLVPLEPTEPTPPIFCVLCGEGSVADGILNAALFFPLGVTLSLMGWRPFRALAVGVLLSCGVEAAQLVIPGRDPSLSDVLFNTLGTALGIALVRSAAVWLWPGPRLADVLGIVRGLGVTLVLALTGVLLGPSFPEDTYYAGWAPRFGHLEWYGGRILNASLDGLEIPPAGVIARSGQLREELVSGATLEIRATAGPRPSGLAPLLAIDDAHQREILLLGVDGEDLVYRYRTRAVAWGLIGPDIRVVGALRGIAWRDPLSIIVRRAGSGYCVRVTTSEYCGLGYTMGRGWVLLLGGQHVPQRLQPVLDVVWAAALLLPIGLWARFGWVFALAAALPLAGLLILPVPIGLLPTPWVELTGAVAGLLAGWISSARLGFPAKRST
jgi:hypothetical protein